MTDKLTILLEQLKEQKDLLEKNQECLVHIKLDIREIKTHQEDHTEQCIQREIRCQKKHNDFEEKLKDTPNKQVEEFREKKIDTIEKNQDNLIKKVYMAVGGLTTFSILFSVFVPLVFKKLGWI